MKKIIALILGLVFICGIAGAENAGILGNPFPDFTAEVVDGAPFTLSEALKDHEAVLINLWASRCPSCRLEFPFLNEVYEQYGDRVAFISLSVEENDTPEAIAAFQNAYGLTLPMGRDEDGALHEYINGNGSVPATVLVDRFGNAVFFHDICFKSSREISSVIGTVLGGGYTETAVLDGIPMPDATAVFPVAAFRSVHVDNPFVRQISFYNGTPEYRLEVYVVNDPVAHLRVEIPASDDPYGMVFYDATAQRLHELPALLDAGRTGYYLDVPMPEAGDECHFVDVCLYEFLNPDDPGTIDVYLIPGEEYLDELCEFLLPDGWAPGGENEGTDAVQDAPQAYVVHVADQYGAPVQGVMVNFCTDTACTMLQSDESGIISFEGAPDVYHVQLLRAPEGYGFDADSEMYIGSSYGEWMLRIRKD